MKRLFILLAMLSTNAFAYNLGLMKPKHVYVEGFEYQHLHDPYLEPIDEDVKYGGVFGTDFYLLHYKPKGIGLYWDNQLHFDQVSTSGHIKHAGWKYELGLSFLEVDGKPKVELFKQHWSRHVMEETRVEHFPVYDRWGIRLNIYP